MLWVVIDPVGTIPVFIAVTAAVAPEARAAVARRAALVATAILLGFLVGGQFLIDALGISLPAFQIAGGIILFLFALTMVFGEAKPAAETREATPAAPAAVAASVAVFPLAVPSLASPGAMLAVVLLTDNNSFSVPEQLTTAKVMVVVMACAWAAMRAAGPILTRIGDSGAAIVSRVMGMILASVAADNVIAAIIQLIRETPS